ncbi:MAG: hypothetical protein KIT84_17755 [Labilithrix sp.]|nr:hypothetical protein [Labilithrix sp.]MCW5812879.1 hypothetical protein [Labilithrix sp.]
MDTRDYIAGGQLETDIQTLLKGKMQKGDAAAPPEAFLAKLPADARRAFDALHARLKNGSFPELYDFNVEWGHDTSEFRNVEPDAFAMANDGAGNYWLVCPDGTVRTWCHEEGGLMEDHNGFTSLDDAFACFVRYAAVREENVSLAEVRGVFEESVRSSSHPAKAAQSSSPKEVGWGASSSHRSSPPQREVARQAKIAACSCRSTRPCRSQSDVSY